MRFLVPVLFLCVAVGVVYGVKTFLQKDRDGNSPPNQTTAAQGATEPAVNTILPPEDDSFESLTENEDPATLPVADPAMPPIGDVKNDFQPELQPVDGGIVALELLEEFLGMKTLEERLPHIETKRAEPELHRETHRCHHTVNPPHPHHEQRDAQTGKDQPPPGR